MLRHLTIMAVLAMGCASVPPQPMPRPVPEVVLWSFIPAFAQDDAPCVLLRPDGRVIARTGCRGSYAEFEPREEDLNRLVAALTSPTLEALEPEYYVAESTDTAENTLQWARSGCRRQVVVDGWLGNGQEVGYPVDRGKTPGPFLAAYDALLSLHPRRGPRPYLPRRIFVVLLADRHGMDATHVMLPVGWPAPARVSHDSDHTVVVTLPGSEFQAAVDWVVEQHARNRTVKVGDVFYWPWHVAADVDGEPQRLAVPPLSVAAKLEGGVAPLVSGNCH